MIGLNTSIASADVQSSGATPTQRNYKPCVVCNDKSSGYHYGVSSCEGCKGFFRRSVQKNVQYVCHKEKSCVINKLTRNRCQYCRFVKCFEKGMLREAVRNDRHKRKQASGSNGNSVDPASGDCNGKLTVEDKKLVETITQAHRLTLPWTQATELFCSTPVSRSPKSHSHSHSHDIDSDTKSDLNRTPTTLQSAVPDYLLSEGDADLKAMAELITITSSELESANGSACLTSLRKSVQSAEDGAGMIFTMPNCSEATGTTYFMSKVEEDCTITQSPLWDVFREFSTVGIVQIVNFAKKVPGFLTIPSTDQVRLLKAACSEIMMIRILEHYNSSYLIQTMATEGYFSQEGLSEFGRSLLSLAMRFSALELDSTEFALLCAICLFTNDQFDLQAADVIEKLQESFLVVLKRYVSERRQNKTRVMLIFAKMLVGLTEVRSISVQHSFRLLQYRNQRGHEAGELLPLYSEMFDRGENVYLI